LSDGGDPSPEEGFPLPDPPPSGGVVESPGAPDEGPPEAGPPIVVGAGGVPEPVTFVTGGTVVTATAEGEALLTGDACVAGAACEAAGGEGAA